MAPCSLGTEPGSAEGGGRAALQVQGGVRAEGHGDLRSAEGNRKPEEGAGAAQGRRRRGGGSCRGAEAAPCQAVLRCGWQGGRLLFKHKRLAGRSGGQAGMFGKASVPARPPGRGDAICTPPVGAHHLSRAGSTGLQPQF